MVPLRTYDRDTLRGCLCFLLDRGDQSSSVAADKLVGPIDHHLGRVTGIETEAADILFLSLRHGIEREGITPALVIPIGDVFAEHDRLCTGDGLRSIEFCEQRIGWRTV